MGNKTEKNMGSIVILGVLLALLTGCGAINNDDNSSDDDSNGKKDSDTGDNRHGTHSIFAIQKGEVPPGTEVTLTGVVATSGITYDGGGMFVQDPEGGPWSGIYVFLYDEVSETIAPKPGDVLNLTGVYEEFYDTSEIKVTSPDSIEIVNNTTPLEPIVLSCSDIATGSADAEAYEGVLVKVENVEVTKDDLGYGEFAVNDGLRVDDIFFTANAAPKPRVGDTFDSITGPLHYAYENYKIEPRSLEDFVGGTVEPGDTDNNPGDTDDNPEDNFEEVTVYQIQKGEVAEKSPVRLKDVIVTSPVGFDGKGFFVQEKDGGAFSGIYIFAYEEVITQYTPKVGDVVTLSGEYVEYHGVSEITVKNAADLQLTGSDTVPAPAVVAAEDVATNGSLAEDFEGVLIQVENVTVTEGANKYGEWTVNSSLLVDDYFFEKDNGPKPATDDEFAKIIGPLTFSWDDFKILPRTMEDLVAK